MTMKLFTFICIAFIVAIQLYNVFGSVIFHRDLLAAGKNTNNNVKLIGNKVNPLKTLRSTAKIINEFKNSISPKHLKDVTITKEGNVLFQLQFDNNEKYTIMESPEDIDPSSENEDQQEGNENDENSESNPNNYDDEFMRSKAFSLSAAAYGDDAKLCLNHLYPTAEIYRAVTVACDNYYRHDSCSAFTAVSHEDKLISLAFRGTNAAVQLAVEMHQMLVNDMIDSPIGGKVGFYFHNKFQLLWENKTVSEDFFELQSQYPDYQILITGHSLGGAMASIAAAHIVADGRVDMSRVRIATLGQPRTGDKDFGIAYNEKLPNSTYRIVNRRDIVPHLPPIYYKNYTHHMAEVWYPKNMNSPADYKICEDNELESKECSNNLYYYSIMNHLYYFGHRIGKNMRNCKF